MGEELTCRELVELVTDYLEERLEPWERRRFEEHLVFCDGCSTYLDQMRRTIGVVGQLSEEDVPDRARDQMLAIFRGWKRER